MAAFSEGTAAQGRRASLPEAALCAIEGAHAGITQADRRSIFTARPATSAASDLTMDLAEPARPPHGRPDQVGGGGVKTSSVRNRPLPSKEPKTCAFCCALCRSAAAARTFALYAARAASPHGCCRRSAARAATARA